MQSNIITAAIVSLVVAVGATFVLSNNMAGSSSEAAMGPALNGYTKQKVVYHVNYPGGPEDKKYKGAMRNIQNHINAVGKENLDLKVVIHGNGIGLLQSAKAPGAVQTAVSNLKSQNVNFSVCANTLKGRKIPQDSLFEVFDEDIVPSGVAELAHLQQQGYTYIKP